MPERRLGRALLEVLLLPIGIIVLVGALIVGAAALMSRPDAADKRRETSEAQFREQYTNDNLSVLASLAMAFAAEPSGAVTHYEDVDEPGNVIGFSSTQRYRLEAGTDVAAGAPALAEVLRSRGWVACVEGASENLVVERDRTRASIGRKGSDPNVVTVRVDAGRLRRGSQAPSRCR